MDEAVQAPDTDIQVSAAPSIHSSFNPVQVFIYNADWSLLYNPVNLFDKFMFIIIQLILCTSKTNVYWLYQKLCIWLDCTKKMWTKHLSAGGFVTGWLAKFTSYYLTRVKLNTTGTMQGSIIELIQGFFLFYTSWQVLRHCMAYTCDGLVMLISHFI